MKRSMRAVLTVSGAMVICTLTACGEKGPAERVGEKVDSMVEKAGQKMETASEKIGSAVENAGETIQEKTQR